MPSFTINGADDCVTVGVAHAARTADSRAADSNFFIHDSCLVFAWWRMDEHDARPIYSSRGGLRRELLHWLSIQTIATLRAIGAPHGRRARDHNEPMTRMPSLFISHGSPTFAIDPGKAGPLLAQLGRELPRPKAVLVMSPHWTTRGLRVATTGTPE